MNYISDMINETVTATEKKLESAKAVVESLKNVIVGSNSVVLLKDASSNSYLRILSKDIETGSVKFNFTGKIGSTPRYTPERAQMVVDEYSTDKRPLRTGNLLTCAKEDVVYLTEMLKDFKEALEKRKD